MNFSRNKVEKELHQLHSPATHRLSKIRLICIRVLILSLILFFAVGISTALGAFHSIISTAPTPDSIQVIPQGYTTTIKDSDGKVIQTLIGKDANREYVTLDKIPSNLQNAFIAVEDERFFSHNGIDLLGIGRAVITGLQNGGSFEQGASTLTQQLLKNQVFGGGAEDSFFDRVRRKIQEQYLALRIENQYDKKQILEYYLNTINLGQNTLGVQAASRRYFNKDVSRLSLSECAVLAGITKNPSAYNPITHPKKNKKRRLTVLNSMKEQGYITTEEYTKAVQDTVYVRIQKVNRQVDTDTKPTSYFTDALITQVIQDMKQKLGYTETQAYNALYSRGLTIYATQDSRMQKTCDRIINDKKYYPAVSSYQLTFRLTVQKGSGSQKHYNLRTMKRWFKKHKNKTISGFCKKKATAKKWIAEYQKHVVGKQDKIISKTVDFVLQPQVSFVLMDQSTGAVKAICGGRGEKTASRTLNRATDSVRQPGSTFKILSTYLPALDTAGMTLASVQDDAKYYYPGTKRLVKNWYGSSYRGLTSMRTAIADSMNVIAVKTLEEVTPKTAFDYLQNLGFTTLVDHYIDDSGKVYTDMALPMALGGLTKGVTNLELTTGFATIANGGVYHRASFYTKILDHDGNVLLDNTKDDGTQVIKESSAWLMTSALQDVISEGTGTALKFRRLDMPQAGKTGTSTDNRDLWFVGYTPYLTAGIWGGYDYGTPQTAVSYHKEIWRTIMEKLNKKYKKKAFSKPDSITSAHICTKCGKLAIDGICEYAVGGSCVKKEYFAKESRPTEKCDCHVKCRICKASGHLAGDNCPEAETYTIVYLQKAAATDQNDADSPLIIPNYLGNSSCEVHGY